MPTSFLPASTTSFLDQLSSWKVLGLSPAIPHAGELSHDGCNQSAPESLVGHRGHARLLAHPPQHVYVRRNRDGRDLGIEIEGYKPPSGAEVVTDLGLSGFSSEALSLTDKGSGYPYHEHYRVQPNHGGARRPNRSQKLYLC